MVDMIMIKNQNYRLCCTPQVPQPMQTAQVHLAKYIQNTDNGYKLHNWPHLICFMWCHKRFWTFWKTVACGINLLDVANLIFSKYKILVLANIMITMVNKKLISCKWFVPTVYINLAGLRFITVLLLMCLILIFKSIFHFKMLRAGKWHLWAIFQIYGNNPPTSVRQSQTKCDLRVGKLR